MEEKCFITTKRLTERIVITKEDLAKNEPKFGDLIVSKPGGFRPSTPQSKLI